MSHNNISDKQCKTCGTRLEIKQTHRSPAQLLKSYYYTAYYFCPVCQKMYHDDVFKVVNRNYHLFTNPELPERPVEVDVWTDGACSNNGRVNAKASWAFVSGDYEEAGLVEGKQTNNTGEGMAILRALEWAVRKGYKVVKIHTDSQISIHNLQKPVHMVKENKGLFEEIDKVIQDNALIVYYQKVPGHSTDVNNNRADKLANGLVGIK